MNVADFAGLAGAIGGLLIMFGGGIKWMLGHIEAKAQSSELRETRAREELSNRLHQEIANLRSEMAVKDAQMAVKDTQMAVRDAKILVQLRRIYDLENFIHRETNLNIPSTIGWPLL